MKRKERAFTLVELVVVVTIISILATISTPKIRMSLLKAKDVKVEATLETLNTASKLYFAEKNRALGSENTTTGSGVAKGVVTGYTPYNESKVAYPVTVDHIKELINKKYLDKKALKSYIGESGTKEIKIIPGVNIASSNCENSELKDDAELISNEIAFIFDSDDVGISLWDGVETNPGEGEGQVDSSCQVWNNK